MDENSVDRELMAIWRRVRREVYGGDAAYMAQALVRGGATCAIPPLDASQVIGWEVVAPAPVDVWRALPESADRARALELLGAPVV